MLIGKLINNVWATKKAHALDGFKFMLAEEIQGSNKGRRFIVVDIVGAGIGDVVIVCTGSGARKMLCNDELPVDAAVVGIVDEDCNFK
ncbi:Ethanolamine utilization protein EutN/carboxysome structural protein Ccml [Alkaliphilus metalliredigens QYMF]|uniref:Ethanolamine utilization protein EutN/carboxysome structural protein Ccml n=1 Tax=Alkaliphilus metalliredigens (strain QYMF) TaxID=293826 RepID=A6TUS8_ALKMQ|nr:EutN/CcmL family microcompartment protein [Alkaliphilus metalliredigens]ABR49946.1 Ethanolamine utilization protein EutN/carboxysome structural protein Ccml [Alkaliphilus metalliredigens QYMF]